MNDTIITVNLPNNLTTHERPLFEQHKQYKLQPLCVKKMQYVFVSHAGFCMDENGLLKECHHHYPEHFENYRNMVGHDYNQAAEDEDKLIYLENDNEYLLIHHPWSNYYHWITESIPKLWQVKGELDKLILILPEEYQGWDFVNKTLQPFTFKDIFYIPTDKSLFVKNLRLPQIKPICASYDSSIVTSQRSFYVDYVKRQQTSTLNCGDKLFVNRKYANRRKIANDDAVQEVLAKHNFVTIDCEFISFYDQVSIFSNARYLVSLHGAGLTNMLFMPPQSSVLELHKRITNANDHHSLVYWYLADALQHNYFHQICEPTDPDAEFFTADFIVDTDKLDENIQHMLSKV